MKFPSTKRVRGQSDRPGRKASSPAAAGAAAFARQLSDIASSGGGGEVMPTASAPPPGQLTGVLLGSSKQPLYSQDAPFIMGLREVLINAGAAQHTAKDYVKILLRFGRWLFENNKRPIHPRLDDESLTDDACELMKEGNSKLLLRAIDHLRTWQATGGVAPIAGRAELNPHPEDAALIKEYKNEAATETGRRNATALSSFSDYLRQNNKLGIADRLSGNGLDGDVRSYKEDAGDDRTIASALAHLRKSRAGARAMERERHIPPVSDAEDVAPMEPTRIGDAAWQHSAAQDAGTWPMELPASGYNEVLLGLIDEPGPSSSAPQPAQSTQFLRSVSNRPLHPVDAPLILGLREALINGGAAERTAKGYVNTLLGFGRWLFENNKRPIHPRLDNESLTDDAREFMKKGKSSKLLLTAIDHLRTWQATGEVVPIAGRAELRPHPRDAALIKEYKNEAATETGKRNATALSSFSDYLRQNNKMGIADRLSGNGLDGDVRTYKEDAGDDRTIASALAHLRKSQAGAKAMERERHIPPVCDPEVAALMEPTYVGHAATAEHSASQEAGIWPKELPAPGYNEVPVGLMDEPGPSSSAPQPAQATQFLRSVSNRPLHAVDTELILGLVNTLKGDAASENVSTLLTFGHWLFANKKDPIKDRLDKQSLTDDAREFIGKRDPKTLRKAIGHLRTWQSTGGIVPLARRAEPSREDAALINEYRNEAATNTVRKYSTALRSFSDYLRQNNKKGIAGRLCGNALDGDVKGYRKDADGDRSIGPALVHLRKSQAGAKAMERERHILPVSDPEDAALMEPRRVGDAAGQHSTSQEAGSRPKELPAKAHDQDVCLVLMDEPGPSLSAPQPAQSTGLRRNQPLYPGDAEIILGLEKALINASEHTVKDYVRSLLSFGRWLLANNKDPIKDRLDKQSLSDDAREFIGKRDPKTIRKAIDHLRTWQSTGGVVPIAGRAELNPYPQDAALIKEYKNETATDTSKRNATALRSFSDYLRQNNKKNIAGRLSGSALDGDVKTYKQDAHGDQKIGPALAHLRKSQAGAKAMERERQIPPVSDPEDAAPMEPRQARDAAGQRSASPEAGSWPKELPANAHDQDLSSGAMDEPGPLSFGPRPARPPGLRRKQPLYPEDAELISGLEQPLIKGGATEGTARLYVRLLRSYGHWLFANKKNGIVTQLNNKSLTDGGDMLEFIGKGNPRRLRTAIGHLRTWQSTGGVVPIAGRAKLNPATEMEPSRIDAGRQHSALREAGSWRKEAPANAHDQGLSLGLMDEPGPSSSALQSTGIVMGQSKQSLYSEDASLISGLEATLIKGSASERTVKNNVGLLRRFGRWLFENNKTSIVARLDNKSLTDGGEVLEFIGKRDPKTLLRVIDRLRTFRSTGEVVPIAGRAEPNPAPDMEPTRVGDAATAEHSASQEAGIWPKELPAPGYNEVPVGLMDEPGPSSSVEPAPRH
ncbi:hypothetical protein, partial [Sinorhizobium psoraleae]|uniref:hypothetical protein n=1 Tax=Sinorhizobium psoraleae TaxID=520838 RepID=UPI0015692ECA